MCFMFSIIHVFCIPIQTWPGLFRRGGNVLARHLQTKTPALIDSHTLKLAVKSNTKNALDFDPFLNG